MQAGCSSARLNYLIERPKCGLPFLRRQSIERLWNAIHFHWPCHLQHPLLLPPSLAPPVLQLPKWRTKVLTSGKIAHVTVNWVIDLWKIAPREQTSETLTHFTFWTWLFPPLLLHLVLLPLILLSRWSTAQPILHVMLFMLRSSEWIST